MRIRGMVLQACVIAAGAVYYFATPAVAEARTNACGRQFCIPSCSEAEFACAECPGWMCTELPTFTCGEPATVTCFSEA
jgi:hypothetical protein